MAGKTTLGGKKRETRHLIAFIWEIILVDVKCYFLASVAVSAPEALRSSQSPLFFSRRFPAWDCDSNCHRWRLIQFKNKDLEKLLLILHKTSLLQHGKLVQFDYVISVFLTFDSPVLSTLWVPWSTQRSMPEDFLPDIVSENVSVVVASILLISLSPSWKCIVKFKSCVILISPIGFHPWASSRVL